MPKPAVPPMLKQYRELKARYPDALLLFRLGDFYELFDEDARIAARELEIVLTSRRFAKKIRLPMCGVPHRRLTVYVGRLIEAGYKVAIAEQVEDARQAKGLVRREVVRVITPGTVVEETLLPDKAENYLVALAVGGEKGGYGLAVVDLSTGEFAATQTDDWPALLEELYRLQPREYVLPAGWAADEAFVAPLKAVRPARVSPLDEAHFSPAAARRRLLAHLGVASLEAYGCEGLPLATSAAGAALAYLQESQLSDLSHLRRLATYSLANFVGLDSVTRRNLELTRTLREGRTPGSLFWALDATVTAMGARLLRRWIHQPLLDLSCIEARLDAVEELVNDHFFRADLRRLLDGLYDVERLVGRIGFGNANARDLVALRTVLDRLPGLKALLDKATSSRLRALNESLDALQDVADLIRRAVVDSPPILVREGGLIHVGYDAELDALRATASKGRDWLAAFEADERARSGIPNLRVKYNEVFGFFIEVTKSHLDEVPPDYERRATVRHAERFVTPELKLKEAAILSAEDRADELEYDLFIELRRRVAAESERLQTAAHVLSELDAAAALAEVAARHGYVRPVVGEGDAIEIREGRHPVVERSLPAGERFVPNDVYLDGEGSRLLVVTGPNMAGKSVYIRQTALIVLMAQTGSFVPAASARVGLADRIFVRAGATDDIAQGRSTFLVEMSETAHILRHATPRSLVVLDEVGRGTSTYDGVGLAWAVGEFLHDEVRARTLFATHFHELTALAEAHAGARNVSLAVAEQGDEVVFLRRVVPGGADRSYGVQVARLAGLPERVIARAAEVMNRLERAGGVEEQESGQETVAIREVGALYLLGDTPGRLLPADDQAIWTVLRELYGLDIANLTPVQALVALNELQNKLKRET
jgi:DNA mismatch repair protein MutS